jgi:hypothetical protein
MRASPERLLTDDRAGRLVVDVEVARRVLEPVLRVRDRGTILGEDGAREPVRRSLVDQVEGLVQRFSS